MRILFASSSSGSRGGGEAYLIYLGEALAGLGHEVILWAASHPRMDETAERFGRFGKTVRSSYANTYDRRGRSLSALLDGTTARRVGAEWRELEPDLVHLNKQNLEDGLDLLHATRLPPCPTVCTIHITQSARFLGARAAWLRDGVARRALRGYRGRFVAVSEPRAEDLRRFLGARGRVAAIPNGVPNAHGDRESARIELGLTPDDFAVLGMGRMTAQKRPLLFLETGAEMLRRLPQAKFIWIGDGPLGAEWDAKAEALGMAGRVRRLGWRQDAATLLAAGDLFLHMAEYEGLSLAVLEAMAAGLPCAIDANLHREMPFLDERNSIRVVNGWMDQLEDSGRLARLGAEAARLAKAQFSTEAMARSYEKLYGEVLGNTGNFV